MFDTMKRMQRVDSRGCVGWNGLVRGVWIGVLGATMALAAGARAWGQEAAAARPQTVLAVEFAGAEALVADPKDAALAAALEMVPARVAELPREMPQVDQPVWRIVELLLDLLHRPMRIAVVYNEEQPEGAFGYGLIVGFRAHDGDDARRVHGAVNALLALAERLPPRNPSARFAPMLEVATPMGVIRYGPREAGGQWWYELLVASVGDPDAAFARAAEPLYPGLSPVVRGRLDLRALTPMKDMLAMFAGKNREGVEEVASHLQRVGLVGPEAMRVDFEGGYTADRSVMVTVVRGARRYVEALGLPVEPLERADLGVIPADATVASIARVNLRPIESLLAGTSPLGEALAGAVEEFHRRTGVHLLDDVVRAMGDLAVAYMSDATGGGSLTSLVVLMEVSDRARLSGANDILLELANTLADQMPLGPGYVRLARWNEGESDLFSLRFRGLPVPLELTYALTDRWLVVGLTPQAVLAAVRQATGRGDEGLASNPAFAAVMPADVQPVSIRFVDTARAMQWGYGLVSLGGSLVANVVRSPNDAGREPGLVVPPFHELRRGVRARIRCTYWRGDDLVDEMHGDRSVLVNLAAEAGVVARVVPVLGLLVGGVRAMEAHTMVPWWYRPQVTEVALGSVTCEPAR